MFQFFWTRTASVWVVALYILMGILLFVFPTASSTLFVWALAAGAGAYGLIHLIRYLQARKMGCGNPGDVFLAVLPAAFAAFSLIWPQAVLSVLPLVLGSLLLVDGVSKLPLAYMGVREQHPSMIPMLLSSIIPILLGGLIIVNPFTTMQLVVMVFGATLAADGISDLVTVILEKRSAQTVQHHSSV